MVTASIRSWVAVWGSGESTMAPMTATPWAPVAITDSTVATVMPAMAMTGTSTASTTARTVHADGVGQPHLGGGGERRPHAQVVAPSATSRRAVSGSRAVPPPALGATTRRTAGTGRSSAPTWTPSASTATARSARSFTRQVAPAARQRSAMCRASRKRSPSVPVLSRTWAGGAGLQRRLGHDQRVDQDVQPPEPGTDGGRCRRAGATAGTAPGSSAGQVLQVHVGAGRRELGGLGAMPSAA